MTLKKKLFNCGACILLLSSSNVLTLASNINYAPSTAAYTLCTDIALVSTKTIEIVPTIARANILVTKGTFNRPYSITNDGAGNIYSITNFKESRNSSIAASTAPTTTGGSVCGSGTVTLTASGSTPAGGVYNWYAAASGGVSLATGTSYTTPVLTTATTYYVSYTASGSTSARTPATATVNANPIIATVPSSGAYFSYDFTGGSTTDLSGSSNTAILINSPSTTTDRYGAVNKAYSFNGSSQYISTTTRTAAPGPLNFSISVWFKTSIAGGLLVGFGNTQTGASNLYDRMIYMSDSGQLYFGVWSGAQHAINTTATYADDNWHHAVAILSSTNGTSLYVDGALQASDATSTLAENDYDGYWRIAYNRLGNGGGLGWVGVPTNYYFTGALDDIGVFNTAISPAQVNVLYGGGSSAICNNKLYLTANTVAGASYTWSGPGGFTSALQNPAVSPVTPGIYVLTVIGSSGCSSTLNVTAPSVTTTSTWSGAAGTTDPTTAGNWNTLPAFDGTSNLVIPSGLSRYPVLTANESVASLTINSGAKFSLGGYTLSVGCNIINNASTGGTGILYGSNNASGITWNGITPQTYTGTNTATTAQVGNMTINNTAGATVTVSGGPLDIYNILTLTKGSLAIGSSPAALTLKSTATQTASVAAIPAGYSITGNVTAERYVTGGSGHRGYRLLSSPVYAGTVGANKIYSINYLLNSTFLTGTNFATTATSRAGNPTLYIYRENMAPLYSAFTNSNFRGIANISASPSYTIDIDGPGYNIPIGNGYFFFFRGDKTTVNPYSPSVVPVAATLSTTGTLNQGTINVVNWFTPASPSLSYTAASPATIRGFNLVGNPYPSTINFEKFNRNGTNSSIYGSGSWGAIPTIYFFNPVTKQFCSYQQKTSAIVSADTISNINPGISSDGFATNMIASGQGFFVRTTAAGQTFSFRETAKTGTQPTGASIGALMGTPQNFVQSLSAAPINFAAQAEPLLRLRMVLDSVNRDEVVLVLNNQDNTAYSFNKDALDMGGNGALESLSLLSSDSVQLSIHRTGLPQKTAQIIPILADATTSGIYQLKKIQIDDLPAQYDVWLKDAFKKDSLDMRANDTYSFNIDKSNPATFGSNRFSLLIRQNPAQAYHLLNFTATKQQVATRQVRLAWVTENEHNYTSFTMERSTNGGKTFDVVGGMWGSTAGNYSILDDSPVIGKNLYRLKQIDATNNVTYSTIIPVEYSPISNNISKNVISVYPNPASGVINLIVAENTKASAYNILITNSSGIIVKQANTTLPSWQGSVANLLPGAYIIKVINNNNSSFVGQTTFVKF
jgi:hypothetical protein